MTNYVGKYRILAALGQGGMGEVFKAQSPEEDIVAVKRILIHIAHQREVLARFERKQRVQQQLQHPNLIPVIDVGEDQGMPFYVMPYTIQQVLHEAGWSWQRDQNWCETGTVLRKRQGEIVAVTDPAEAKNLTERAYTLGEKLGLQVWVEGALSHSALCGRAVAIHRPTGAARP